MQYKKRLVVLYKRKADWTNTTLNVSALFFLVSCWDISSYKFVDVMENVYLCKQFPCMLQKKLNSGNLHIRKLTKR